MSTKTSLSPAELRKTHPAARPSVLKTGPIFGLGYRSPWKLGNIIQAQVARKYGLSVMLAQQSAREIERTHRTFQDVVDSATVSAVEAQLTQPWGADGDHLRNETEVMEAARAGCTHFTYDVAHELKQGMPAVIDKASALYQLTHKLKGHAGFTSEISMDETEHPTRVEDILHVLTALKHRNVTVTEIAPRFPGYFEKAIDYYRRIENGKKVHDPAEFESFLRKLAAAAQEHNFRVCVHSGSDKFSIYPVLARILKQNFHLKTAGTYYLEELKIIARHDPALFHAIFRFSMTQFNKDRASYELSCDPARMPDLNRLAGPELARLLQSGGGNDDLRQVLHVTYGSVLTELHSDGTPVFTQAMVKVLQEHLAEYAWELEAHIRRHIKDFVAV